MKNVFYILTFLLFLLPTSNAMACGNSEAKASTEQSCCQSEKAQDDETKSCCDTQDNDSDNDCNGTCNNSNCHCPISVSLSLPTNTISLHSIPLILVEITNWAFIQNAPKPVYLSIWQPPKIS